MQVRDSVEEAIAEVPNSTIRPGMEVVIETVVHDIARDMVAVSRCTIPFRILSPTCVYRLMGDVLFCQIPTLRSVKRHSLVYEYDGRGAPPMSMP